jgi:phosphonate transport system ATP-binding protein
MQDADIILADEPIASLDPESAKTVMQALRDINQIDGKTVIVTLHQVDYARRYCDFTAALKQGQVKYYGEIASLDDAFLDVLYGAELKQVEVNKMPEEGAFNLQLN